jgi:hypothetical protein
VIHFLRRGLAAASERRSQEIFVIDLLKMLDSLIRFNYRSSGHFPICLRPLFRSFRTFSSRDLLTQMLEIIPLCQGMTPAAEEAVSLADVVRGLWTTDQELFCKLISLPLRPTLIPTSLGPVDRPDLLPLLLPVYGSSPFESRFLQCIYDLLIGS